MKHLDKTNSMEQKATAISPKVRYESSWKSFTCSSSAQLAHGICQATIDGLGGALVWLSTGELGSCCQSYTTRNLDPPDVSMFHVDSLSRECRSIMSEAVYSGRTKKQPFGHLDRLGPSRHRVQALTIPPTLLP